MPRDRIVICRASPSGRTISLAPGFSRVSAALTVLNRFSVSWSLIKPCTNPQLGLNQSTLHMSSDKETPPPTSTTTRRRLVPRLPVFLACALLAIGGVAFNYFWLSRPIGSGPAGPAVSAALFAKPWSTNPDILVGLGDSVTDGFGARKNY